MVHCERVLKKNVFIGGGKGGDSAIQPTVLRGHRFGCPCSSF